MFRMMNLIALIALTLSSASCATLYEEMSAKPYEPNSMPIFREVIGGGPQRIVLIHGLGGSSRYWESRLPFNKAHYTFLIIDLLGFGRSPKPDSDYSLSTQVGAVTSAMAEEGFLVPGTIIVGHSLGALITLGILAKEPHIPMGGVLLSIPIFDSPEDAKSRLGSISLMHRGIIEGSVWVRALCHMRDFLRTPLFNLEDDLPEEVFEDGMRHTWISMTRTLRAIVMDGNPRELADRIDGRKILFIHGAADATAPYQNAVNFAKLVNGSHFLTLVKQGHNNFLSRSNLTWQGIESFERDLGFHVRARNLLSLHNNYFQH